MTINQFKNGNNLTVIPGERLDSATSGEFQDFLTENFTADVEKLTLDFSQVDFISSKGLRVLVSTYKGLEGRKMEIINANASVKEVLRLSGLLKIFDVK